jgi:hypothetical protein
MCVEAEDQLNDALPGVDAAIHTAVTNRTDDMHRLLIALVCGRTGVTGDLIAAAVDNEHASFDVLHTLDVTVEVAAAVLAATPDTVDNIIAGHIRTGVETATSSDSWTQICYRWSDTWTEPWQQPLPGNGDSLRTWRHNEATARLTTHMTRDMTDWAQQLRRRWTPLHRRRYLTETTERLDDAFGYLGRLYVNHMYPHLDAFDVVAGPVAAYVNPLLAADIDTNNSRQLPASGPTYADVTDDTDHVIATALQLARDGAPVGEAVRTARALYPQR